MRIRYESPNSLFHLLRGTYSRLFHWSSLRIQLFLMLHLVTLVLIQLTGQEVKHDYERGFAARGACYP